MDFTDLVNGFTRGEIRFHAGDGVPEQNGVLDSRSQ
jgi:hypothetical protein